MFPIEKPVWVLLINLGQMFDFRVADEVWSRFLRGEGIIRYKGYGMGYSQIENRYRQSEWHPDSICRIISDGGVCGRQARLARRSDHLLESLQQECLNLDMQLLQVMDLMQIQGTSIALAAKV